MPRPLRFVPANSVVEITTRTLQGRLLLKPLPAVGVSGKLQEHTGTIAAP
jgi:hypothetical protein